MVKDKPIIKIFVSHRIDKESEIIENPLYIPVRCGAVFDKRKNVAMLGDNTGDNISEKRLSFCELTVQYWAWKNQDADYYGLCHYRRYLNVVNKDLKPVFCKMTLENNLSKTTQKRCGLLDEKLITNEIIKYDVIHGFTYTIEDTLRDTKLGTIKDNWLTYEPNYLDEYLFTLLSDTVKTKFPQYYQDLIDCYNGRTFIGYNIFIMKKKYFNELCEFMFGTLFEMENKVMEHVKNTNSTRKRAIGYLSEWLFTVYMFRLKKENKARIAEKQIIAFANTDKEKAIIPKYTTNNNVIVFFAENYAFPILSVVLISLIKHVSLSQNYDIIILQSGDDTNEYNNFLKNDERKTILRLIENNKNVSIRFYDPIHNIGRLEQEQNKQNYYLSLLPWILTEYDKVLVLGNFMHINSDICSLYNIDIEKEYCAGVKDLYFYALKDGALGGIPKELRAQNLDHFIEGNVVLINLKLIREKFNKEDVIKTCLKTHFVLGDLFNVLYGDNIKFLPMTWNYLVIYEFAYFYTQNKNPFREYIPEVMLEEYNKINNPKIYNFRKIDLNSTFYTYPVRPVLEFLQTAKESQFYPYILFEEYGRCIEGRFSIIELFIRNFSNRNSLIKRLKNKVSNTIKKYFKL